jgi:thiol-disulfide isomerase/thioredoxin
VLLNFWTFPCYNCRNAVPSLVAFDSVYRARGLTVVGIHTPEFPPYAGEHDAANVTRALRELGIAYPNALDNDRATWDLYRIRYWPSYVLIDRHGQIRYEGYGVSHRGSPPPALGRSYQGAPRRRMTMCRPIGVGAALLLAAGCGPSRCR